MREPRPPKRARTRRKLIEAGLRVLADKGVSLTATDVVVEADVSNGTFYNHFSDLDDFIGELAHESLEAVSTGSAEDTDGADPAWRFALATTRVLDLARRQPLWGRAVLRLADCPTPPQAEVQRHLRADLAEGHRTGRFWRGDDPVTLDMVIGTIMATVRRLSSLDEPPSDDAVSEVVIRLLEGIGVSVEEAGLLAHEALVAERSEVWAALR